VNHTSKNLIGIENKTIGRRILVIPKDFCEQLSDPLKTSRLTLQAYEETDTFKYI
jgi:hypothetical protein